MAKQNQRNKPPGKKKESGNGSAGNPQIQAHRQAEKDIEGDLETSAHSPHDDLDEGELARLGENGNPVE